MTVSKNLLLLCKTALLGATAAGNSVFTPGDIPAQDAYPILRLRTPRERKESLGRNGAPEFTVTTTVRVIGQVCAQANAAEGEERAEDLAYDLARQVEVQLINNPPIMGLLQQYAAVSTDYGVTADGETHLGAFVMDLELEFYQDASDFFPITGAEITEVTLTTQYPTPSGAPVGFDIDLS